MYLATQADPQRSPRYSEILRPFGMGDELRAALRDGRQCWGFICLHRERQAPEFTPKEISTLRYQVPHLANGLRNGLLLGSSTPFAGNPGPGILVLSEQFEAVSANDAAEVWMEEMGDWPRRADLPLAVSAIGETDGA